MRTTLRHLVPLLATLAACAGPLDDSSESLGAPLAQGETHGSVSVVSAASYDPRVAVGSLAAVFGPAIGGCTQGAATVPLPRETCGTRVLVEGTEAPLLAVTPDQVNIQIPFEAPIGAAVRVKVLRNGQTVLDSSAAVSQRAPALFTVDQTGGGPIAAVLPDGSPHAESKPASHGQYVAAFGTGLGRADNFAVTGAAAPGAPLSPVAGITAFLGNRAVPVSFAGKAPGFVGLDQINVSIPEDTLTGRYLLRVCDGGQCSQSTATLFVRGPACDKPALVPQGTRRVGNLDLNLWLGAERQGALARTPKHGIPVQLNGFERDDITCYYRARLEWVDNAWDAALASYRGHFGQDVALPSITDFLDVVTINATLGYTNTSEVGATYYHSAIRTGPGNVHNRIEDVIHYKSTSGEEVSLCNNGIELEMIKGIGLWRGMPFTCAAQLDDVFDFDCKQKAAGQTLLTPMCL